jgi:dipeptide/tripeptide permease
MGSFRNRNVGAFQLLWNESTFDALHGKFLIDKRSDAAIIYGGFLALCYLNSAFGRFIADKYIGNRFAIIVVDH